MEPKSFTDQLKDASERSVGTGSAPQKGQLVAKSIMECLLENTGGNQAAAMELMSKSLAPVLKQIGSVDVMALRLVTLSDRVATQYNPETRFLNFLEAKNSSQPLNDYQLRIIEQNIVTNYASPFNMDAASLPGQVQSQWIQRYNTATAIGDTIKDSYMAQNLLSLQGQPQGTSQFEREVDLEIIRIRKGMNRTLLANVEVVSEAAGQIPQLGGFITRSTNAPISAGGGNFTNALLQQGMDQIAALYGYDQCALFVTKGQMAVIRDLMINRFPGENSATFRENMAGMFSAVDPDAKGLQTNVCYMPYPGMVIPVYYDLDMPANTAIMFKADFPRLARMKFGGSTGPHLLMRPEATLFDLALVFDLYSLEDGQVNSRVQFTNLAS